MRMGRAPKKRKASSRAAKAAARNPNPPKFASPTLVVGQVSPNVIASVLAPRLREMAVRSVEAYADRALWEDAALPVGAGAEEAVEEAVLDLDGSVASSSSEGKGAESGPALLLFQSQGDIDELDTLLSETASHFTTPGPGGARKQLSSWRVHLNAAKFERLLDERYGRFRPLVERHPEIEMAFKGLQRRYAMGKFSPFRERPVGMSTAIMVLFMMHRQQVRTDALLLAAAFCLVGLQPWALVTLVALGRWEAGRRRDRRARGMPRRLAVCRPYHARGGAEGGKEGAEEEEEDPAAARRRKHALLAAPVGVPDDPAAASGDDDRPDVLVLGDGAPALYAGALLARAGRRVRVLCPLPDASGCVTHLGKGKSFAGVPFDIGANVVAHLSRQQPLLAPALCTASDAQGGVRFARVGSAADGYAHAVLSVPDAGVEGTVVNAEGPTALAEHCAACLGDGTPGGSGLVIGKNSGEGDDDVGGSASLGYLRAVAQLHETAGSHYLAKLLPGYGGKGDAADGNAYRKACLRSTAGFLDMCLPHTPRVRALMAALGSPHEDAGPAATCLAAHVSHLCAMTSPEGMAYPVGGPRALCHALASVIEQCGGRVVTGVSPQELLFETVPEEGEKEEKDKAKKKKKKEKKEKEGKPGDDEAAESAGPKPRCRGVRLQDGREVAVAEGGAVVSMLGLVPTFLHLVPPPVRAAHGVPPGLPAVSERRPLLRILVGLRGSAVDLDVTGADWHRLSAAAATGGDDAADDGGAAAAGPRPPVRSQRSRAAGETAAAVPTPRRAKFDAGRSWMKVSFPSAKDPSWQARHPGITTCVVTIEADDDFVTAFETRPRIFSTPKVPEGAASRLVDRVIKDLVKNFPQLEDKIECVQLCGPLRAGLTQDPARFAIAGNRPASPFPGLFCGGADLTVSDSFAGAIGASWLAANAVAGYSSFDLLHLDKNITSDLARFLEEPEWDEEEDLAVPLESVGVCVNGAAATKKENEKPTDSAESSKEE